MVIKLSRGRSVGPYVRTCVGRSVGLSSALWPNSGSDPDAVWHRRSDASKDETGSGFGDRSTERGTSGANVARAIVTNGNFTAYVCDSAATRHSSQITFGKLVIIII